MRKTTIRELESLANEARDEIWEKAKSQGRQPKIYLHWTAGGYETPFSDYHVCIEGDGSLDLSVSDLSETLSHTYKRNTGSVGIALCCCFDATSNDIGRYPPTAAQIETMAQAIAAIANGLWLTIDKYHVMTHGEAANNEDGIFPHKAYAWWNDGYGDGDTRGDLEFLGTNESPKYNPNAKDGSRGGDVLRGKANWYRKKWEDEKRAKWESKL